MAGDARPAWAEGGWSDTTLHVVGGPVLSGGELTVLSVTSAHLLRLTAVSPRTGQVLWSKPSSPSEITPGVGYTPVSVGPIVLNLAPVGAPSDPEVTVEGINAVTGKVAWKVPGQGVVTDAPVICGTGGDFCVDAATATTSYLLVVNGATGTVAAAIGGPVRNISGPQSGAASQGSLWELDDNTPTLAQLSVNDKLLWARTVRELFGGPNYTPDYGWDFVTKDGLDVGSVGYKPSAGHMPLDKFETVGISAATGQVKWRVAGSYACGGLLLLLSADVVCDYSGTATEAAGGTETYSGLGLTLRGLDVATGRTTWTFKVVVSQKGMNSGAQTFLDGEHLVVEGASGKMTLLDAVSGGARPVAEGQVFWCQEVLTYNLDAPAGATGDGQRTAAPEFGACSADGTAAAGTPTAQPSSVGVDSGGLFVWPARHGLRAVPVR
jgi:hypothetical protein